MLIPDDMVFDDMVLKYVKEHSPKRYAAKIEKRCQNTLNKINEIVNTKHYNESDRIMVPNGCPHCKKNCSRCLWTEAVVETNYFGDNTKKNEVEEACTFINFNGYNWPEVTSFVVLHPTKVTIFPFLYWNGKLVKKTDSIYKKAVKFLQGHIDWAKEDGWGKYRK